MISSLQMRCQWTWQTVAYMHMFMSFQITHTREKGQDLSAGKSISPNSRWIRKSTYSLILNLSLHWSFYRIITSNISDQSGLRSHSEVWVMLPLFFRWMQGPLILPSAKPVTLFSMSDVEMGGLSDGTRAHQRWAPSTRHPVSNEGVEDQGAWTKRTGMSDWKSQRAKVEISGLNRAWKTSISRQRPFYRLPKVHSGVIV